MTDARDEVLEELVSFYGAIMITWYALPVARAAALWESGNAQMTAIHAHVEARMRAAVSNLLREALVVHVGRDDEGAVVALDPASGTHEVLPEPFDSISLSDLPPGMVRRYALVSVEEEECDG